MTIRSFIVLAFALFSIQTSQSQVSKDSKLFQELMEMDQKLFQKGFNECDLMTLESVLQDDLEFYHDTGGFQNRALFFETFKENICNNANYKPIRVLIEESLEVYPLKENGILYGAIQNGEHLFYIKEPEKAAYQTSSAKFTSVWILDNNDWKLSRVLSYDHQPPSSK